MAERNHTEASPQQHLKRLRGLLDDLATHLNLHQIVVHQVETELHHSPDTEMQAQGAVLTCLVAHMKQTYATVDEELTTLRRQLAGGTMKQTKGGEPC